jgi:carbon-monoxide dehydrogenase medium subunit
MRFEYLQPTTINEALALLDKYQGDAKIIAGGTDLMLKMRAKVFNPKYVIDISGIAGLDNIGTNGKKGLRIGSLTTIRDIETSKTINQQFSVLSQAASQLGSVAIRNVATIGGNLCHAAPSAECAPALLCLSAKATIVGPKKERIVPFEEFFLGPGTTILAKNEILLEIQVPISKPNTKGVYLKHSQRGSIDLATVGVAVVVTFEPDKKQCIDIKIALGAVAPTPIRARQAENILKGKTFDETRISASAEAAAEESCCITDVRASEEYRKEMVKVYTKRAISMLVPK